MRSSRSVAIFFAILAGLDREVLDGEAMRMASLSWPDTDEEEGRVGGAESFEEREEVETRSGVAACVVAIMNGEAAA